MKTLKFLLILAITSFAFAACSNDDDPVTYQNTVKGEYSGWTNAVFSYNPAGMNNDGDKIAIEATGENLVKIVYTSTRWGTAEFNNVKVSEGDNGYIFAETAGKIKMPNMQGDLKEYDCILKKLTISKDKQTYSAEILCPSIMGGTTLTFQSGTMPEESQA